jgi:hypothetical protein
MSGKGDPMKSECGESTFVEHLLAEHRRLDHMVCSTLSALPSWEEADSTSWPPRVIAGLSAIRAELAQHFAEEEAGGCLEEAVARCPALSTDVRRAQAEHQQLLEVLDELVHDCRNLEKPTRREVLALEQELRALVHKLRLHEGEETRIMQRAFAVCLENADGSE